MSNTIHIPSTDMQHISYHAYGTTYGSMLVTQVFSHFQLLRLMFLCSLREAEVSIGRLLFS